MKANLVSVVVDATQILKDRGARYGEDVLERTAKLASLKLNREVSTYEVAIIMESIKDARRAVEPHESEHSIDGMNYRALATTYRPERPVRPFNPNPAPDKSTAQIDKEVAKQIAMSESDLAGNE
jgi:hypothetical protein